jgi:hypothetical protein
MMVSIHLPKKSQRNSFIETQAINLNSNNCITLSYKIFNSDDDYFGNEITFFGTKEQLSEMLKKGIDEIDKL